MQDLKTDFPPSTLNDWINQLQEDITENEFGRLVSIDEIEEVEIKAFQNQENSKINHTIPGEFPYIRGIRGNSNNWANGMLLKEKDCLILNKKALEALMNGVDSLTIDLTELNGDYSLAFEKIGFEYIYSNFILNSKTQFEELMKYFKNQLPQHCFVHFDYFQYPDKELCALMLTHLKQKQAPAFLVNGYGIHQIGATSWQEIAFCLSTGHEYLLKLVDAGMNIDEAAACIHFQVGIGSNYLIEIAKIRGLRMLWAKLIQAYHPVHQCSSAIQLSAIIGTMNKSLQDPHTNLLRQTTEIMSAVNGGVSQLIVLPYDWHAADGPSELAQRMAINISLLLQEESYFNQVIDPIGGSYVLEDLTNQVAQKSWSFFQQLEKEGGASTGTCIDFLKKEITQKRNLRIEQIKTNKKLLIGINKYQQQQSQKIAYRATEKYLNIPALNYEFENYSGE